MYWLRVGQKFYNLHNVAKIDYTIENDRLIVNIYSGFNVEPLQLLEKEAALFLDTIGRAEGCWAFWYPENVSRLIRDYLKLAEPSESSNEIDELVDELEVE